MLAAGEWINIHDNLILCEPTGIGKKLAGLCPRPQGLPRQPFGTLYITAHLARLFAKFKIFGKFACSCPIKDLRFP